MVTSNGSHVIRCAHCWAEYAFPDILDHCASTYPGVPWLYLSCPVCGRMWVLEVSLGRVALGVPMGLPTDPLAFVAFQQIAVPGLIVDPGSNGVRLQLGTCSWFVPAGPGANPF